ncbi:cytochrome P450 [Dactylosporangium sp. NPDC005572]|uniref:cytochrome P450 n=1 Tax=Dactylosporangium sp. NPDC005572 TaxID=3156889 RepID=UPI0033B18017
MPRTKAGLWHLRVRPGFRPYLVGDPDLVERVWKGSADTYLRQGMMWSELAKLQGTTGVGAEGAGWRPSHDLLQAFFSASTVRAMIPKMATAVRAAVDDLAQHRDQPISLVEAMMAITLRVLRGTFFGDRVTLAEARQVGAAIDGSYREIQARIAVPDTPDWIPMPGDRRRRQLTAEVDSVVHRLVERARDEPEGQDVISMLAHATIDGQPLGEQLVRNNLVNLWTGGTETTALTLAWLLIVLQDRADIAAKSQAEIDEVVGGPAKSVDAEHPGSLKYTKMVLQETLRLYPPAWTLPRGVVQPTDLGGVALQPGDTVIRSPYLTQRMPEWWPDPLVFEPTRWEQRPLHPWAWFAFGGGIHRCLGQYF